MDKGSEAVILAAEACDTVFWNSIGPCVRDCAVPVRSFFSEDDLIAALHTDKFTPSAIFLSVTCTTDMDITRTIHKIRNLVETVPLVITVHENLPELENDARRAGIFYYMILPTKREEIEAVVLATLRHGARSRGLEVWDQAGQERR